MAIITGTPGNDYIFNESLGGGNTITTGDGDDIIQSYFGDDTVDGGAGIDGFQFLRLKNNEDAMTIDVDRINATPIKGLENVTNVEFTYYLSSGNGNDLITTSVDRYHDLNGGAGNDTIIGSGSDELISGDDDLDETGDDSLFGGGGDDNIIDLGGKDTIDGGDGNDIITVYDTSPGNYAIVSGGAGNDYISSTQNNLDVANQIDGGSGDDIILVAGKAIAKGGDGNDFIVVLSDKSVGYIGDVSIEGGAGNDTIFSYSEVLLRRVDNRIDQESVVFLVDGGAGDDYINLSIATGSNQTSVIDGGSGFDVLAGLTISGDTPVTLDLDAIPATLNIPNLRTVKNIESIQGLRTGGGNDNITASGNQAHNISTEAGDDTVSGGSGNDAIYSGSGNDIVSSGLGNDIIESGEGDDTISGGAGDDALAGQEGNDFILGGDGNDRLYGWIGNDVLNGDAGNDNLYADDGNDVLNGGAGDDNLYADNGDDILNGGAGFDNMYGGLGSDILFGGDDIDNLEGGSGNDTLRGGKGNDILSGEGNNNGIYYVAGVAGADTFAFDSLSGATFADLGVDRITDFQAGIDKILLDQTIFTALPSTLTATSFQVVANIADAATSNGLIVYSQGQLFYNANGAAAGYGTGGAFATFDNPAPTLSTSDFLIS
jgi:Ca2+-binding RTX toxin-like protein